MEQVDKDLIRKFMLGGAGLGGGAALVSSLINHFNTLAEEKERSEREYRNKLHQDAVIQARGAKKASIRGGLAVTGGVGATLGSYALVKEIYRELKKKRLQHELEAAKTDYVETLRSAKTAAAGGKPMTTMEVLTSLPVAIPLLLMAGAGVFSNRMLEENFPTPTKRKRRQLRPAGGLALADVEEEEEDYGKQASASSPSPLRFLGLLLMGTKEANSPFADMVGAVLSGREAELTEAMLGDPAEAMDSVKGAAAATEGRGEAALSLAIGLIADNPVLCKVASTLVAAEMLDVFPSCCKLAAALPEEYQDGLADLAQAVSDASVQDSAEGYEPTEEEGKAVEGHVKLVEGLNTLNATPPVSEEASDAGAKDLTPA